ncbi:hypothetical protein [Ichthyobacterium seriolicida]|uniref:Rod shape-determining protein MreD n=1 Tax=Ichthyobacterium seriolicida TaxID=242600 RepID=A0A1J1DZD1_9FLAO|nr:hypothetical protein [Ichthyobacterium seriolicida]BAV94021.1 rod shape-determining protein MreD [Ichthyobacterium seriolicida]
MNRILKYLLSFIFLIIVQVVLLKTDSVLIYTVPFIYIYSIIYPLRISFTLQLILSFVIGQMIDNIQDTGGIHSLACITLILVKKGLYKYFLSSSEVEHDNFFSMIFYKMYIFVFILSLVHCFVITYLKSNEFDSLSFIIYTSVVSAFLNSLLLILFISLTRKVNTKRNIIER